nr:Obg family GTPase CgtA [Gammaproteobacteria bacterium]
VLIHLLDGAASDPLEDWAMINQELSLYDARLEERPQLVVLNKIDLVDGEAWEPLIRERIEESGYPYMAISAVTGKNVRDLIYRVKQMLDEAPEVKPISEEIVIIRPEPDESVFTIKPEGDGWRVSGRRIERIAAMTYWEFEATTRRFQQILDSMGISQALTEAGVEEGDTVYIGEEVLEWSE